MTPLEFLLARVDEDEESGREIARHGFLMRAERIAAECDAKRRLMEEQEQILGADNGWWRGNEFGLGRAIKYLALPYADHPDYREEWRP